jgi:hypothetical protein
MLPASFQTPAAFVLLAGGVIACFAGYRVFRVVLGIYGFILGALFASSAMGTEHTTWMIVAALAGGIVGALAASLLWASLGREPGALVVILFSIAGALGALALQRYVIIGATAFGGGWTIIVGALALLGRRVTIDAAARNNVWLAYPMNPAPGQYWILFAWIALGVVGVIVQLALPGGGKKKS